VETPRSPGPDEETDRDLGAGGDAQPEHAELERELHRIEGTEETPEG
jgi:hypothetical protein